MVQRTKGKGKKDDNIDEIKVGKKAAKEESVSVEDLADRAVSLPTAVKDRADATLAKESSKESTKPAKKEAADKPSKATDGEIKLDTKELANKVTKKLEEKAENNIKENDK